MKVKIVKCSGEDYWYKDYVGQIVEVEPHLRICNCLTCVQTEAEGAYDLVKHDPLFIEVSSIEEEECIEGYGFEIADCEIIEE